MVRKAGAVVAIVLTGLLRDPGCGGGDGPEGGVNAPCTRSKDCKRKLECSEGVCVEPDSGVPEPVETFDAALKDDAADAGDAGG